MTRTDRLATTLYRRLLRLYPAPYRRMFAEEMDWVFTMALNDAKGRGLFPVTRLFFKEIGELPVAILMEHVHERRKRAMRLLSFGIQQDIRMVRWLARFLSLLPVVFTVLIILFNEDARMAPTPPTIITGLLTLFLLIAWHWEKEAGTVLMLGAPILLIVLIFNAARLDFAFGPALLVGGALAFPYLVLGWLFYSLGQQAGMAQAARPAGQEVGAKLPGVLTYLVFAMLVLVVAVFYVIGYSAPVSQEIRVAAAESCTGTPETIRSMTVTLPPSAALPQSLAGYELYGYLVNGNWRFALSAGLERVESPGDAPPAIVGTTFAVQGVEALGATLDQLPAGESLTWCGFDRPDETIRQSLNRHSEQLGLRLSWQ